MPGPPLTSALRLAARIARALLRTTRDVADLGLAALAPDLAVVAEVDPEIDDDVWLDEIPPDIVYVDGDEDSASEPEAPFAGYDALRAVDVIDRLADSDAAALGAIELYEQAHRRRKTVLDALAREARRRG